MIIYKRRVLKRRTRFLSKIVAEGAVPVVHAPRKAPVPQKAKVVEELKRMEKLGVIVRQEEPTEWVN